jgi:hypothetical protein
MSTPKTGNDFEHLDIAGTEQVKESYRAALQEEPRAIIDDAIRAAARRAVSSAPTSMGKRWTARWTTPLAAAATVMLTSSVIFMAVRDRPEVAPPIAEMVAARDAAKAAPEVATKAAAAAAPAFERDLVERGVEKNADKVAEKRTDAVASVSAPAPTIVAQPLQQYQLKEKKLPAPEPVAPVAAARMQDSSVRAVSAPPAPAIPLEKSSPAPIKSATALAETAKAPAKVLSEAKKEAVASNLNMQDTLRRKQTDSEATADLIAKATGVSAPPPAVVAGASVAAPPTPPPAELVAAPPVAAAPAPAPTSESIEKPRTFSQLTPTAASEKRGRTESADAWIKRMTELKRQEKNKELTEEVARFRKRYPSVELPKELTEVQN